MRYRRPISPMSVFDRRRRLAGSWAVFRATSTHRPPAVTAIRSPPTTWRREKTLPLDIGNRNWTNVDGHVKADRKVLDPYSLVDEELWWKVQHEGGSAGSTLGLETLEKENHDRLVSLLPHIFPFPPCVVNTNRSFSFTLCCSCLVLSRVKYIDKTSSNTHRSCDCFSSLRGGFLVLRAHPFQVDVFGI